MPILNISKGDLMRGMPLPPGWYKCKVENCLIGPSRDAKSVNYKFILLMTEAPNEGRELQFIVNSQAVSMVVPLYQAVLDKKIDPQGVTDSFTVDTDHVVGKMVQVKVEDEPYNGRIISKVKDFAPMSISMETPF